ncbi:MAG: tetratricopeptide repeat protein [Candidatus Riflebacteria bacterium]|nr:tetratricopeptide repeat protein [Candidatus Riflebacteria bacterium]
MSKAEKSLTRFHEIYVSSTFPDFKAERRLLERQLFPQIRNYCEKRGIIFNWVDFRSGLENEKVESSLLKIMLERIRTPHTFFSGMVGFRYGLIPQSIADEILDREPWLARHPQCSINEIEYLAFLLDEEMDNSKCSLFFRSEAIINSLSSTEKEIYTESIPDQSTNTLSQRGSEEHFKNRQEKLSKFKETIQKANQLAGEFENLQEFGDKFLSRAIEQINRFFPKSIGLRNSYSDAEPHFMNVFEHEFSDQENELEKSSFNNLARNNYFNLLDSIIDNETGPFCIHGEKGSGKTSIIRTWTARKRFKSPEVPIFYHSFSETDQLDSQIRAWNCLFNKFSNFAEFRHPISNWNELKNEIPGFLKKFADNSGLIIIFDNMNHLPPPENHIQQMFVPPKTDKVKMIFITTSERLPGTFSDTNLKEIEIRKLNTAEARGITKKFLRERKISLDQQMIEKLTTVAPTTDVCFLSSMLESISENHNLVRVNRSIVRCVEKNSLDELFNDYLQELEEIIGNVGSERLKFAFSYIFESRRGISELELRELISLSDALPRPEFWYPFVRELRRHLKVSSGLFRFGQNYFRAFFQKAYLSDPAFKNLVRQQLGDYFIAREPSPRTTSEALFQFKKLEAWEKIYETLSNPAFFSVIYAYDPLEVIELWKQIEDNSSFKITDAYLQYLYTEEKPSMELAFVSEMLSATGHCNEAVTLMRKLYEKNKSSENASIAFQITIRQTSDLMKSEKYSDALYAIDKFLSDFPDSSSEVNMAELFLMKGRCLLKTGNTGEAENLIQQSSEIFSKRFRHSRIIEVSRTLAELYQNKGDYTNSLKQYKALEEAASMTDSKLILAEALYGQATIQKLHGELDSSLALLGKLKTLSQCNNFNQWLVGCLNLLAAIFRARGNMKASFVHYREAEEICRSINDQTGLQIALGGQALIFKARGELDTALKLFQEQERICRELQIIDGMQIALSGQAAILRDRGQLDDAMTFFKQAEKICRKESNWEGLQRILCNIAMVHRDKGELDEAIIILREGEKLCNQYGLKLCRQRTLESLALVLKSRGDLDGAFALLKEQEKICRELGVLIGLQVALGNQAHILHFRGDYDQAMEMFSEQERICRQLGLKDRLQAALNGQAVILRARGEIEKATVLLQEQENICLELGLKAGLQICYYNQGIINLVRGNLSAAYELFKKQEKICIDAGYQEGLQASLGSQAVILRNRGDLNGAAALFTRQEKICRDSGYKEGLQISLCGKAVIFAAHGNLIEALDYLEEGEKICREMSHKEGLQRILCVKASIFQSQGNLDSAFKLLKEAEKICRSLDHKSGLQRVLENEASLLISQKKYDEALVLLREQEEICRNIGIKAGLQASLGQIAMIYQEKGDIDSSLHFLKEQEMLCRSIGLHAPLAKNLTQQALILSQKKNSTEEALFFISEGYKIASEHGLASLATYIKSVLDGIKNEIDTASKKIREIDELKKDEKRRI